MGHEDDAERRRRDSERKAAYRERQRLAELDRGKPWQGLLGEEREQAIRDHFGYAKSEKRTQAERERDANRIRAKLGPPDDSFKASFPARAGDLTPTPEQLKRLGLTLTQ